MPNLKFVKISWEKFEGDCLSLAKKLKTEKIDKIIAISRGGLVAGRIFSDLLDAPISHITIASYRNLKQEKEPFISEAPSRVFHGENILIVDEISDSGKTFKRALSYFNNFNIKKIYTLAPYIKPKTQFIPDFWQEKIDAWIIFPYELKETTKAFLDIFKSKEKAVEKLLEVGFKRWEIDNIL